MGILNTTPDSFADGEAHLNVEEAVAAGAGMVAAGAEIIDVGGESTRPGASLISVDEEIQRVVPVVEQLAGRGIIVSVDTSKPEVALTAIAAGAVAINDVTGLENPKMRDVCADAGVGVVIMHMQGTPRTMQRDPQYDDVVNDIRAYLVDGAEAAIDAGIAGASIVIDPGIGFGKTFGHNIELLGSLDVFVDTGLPVLLGTSRKGTTASLTENLNDAAIYLVRDRCLRMAWASRAKPLEK